MKVLKKIGRWFATIFLGFLLVITIVSTIFIADTRATVMSSDWVKDEMDKGNFYPAIRQELADNLKESLADSLNDDDAQKIGDTIDAAVSDSWAKANFESNADIAYSYFKSESDNLELSVTLPATMKQGIKDAIADIFTAQSTGLTSAQITAGLSAVNKQVDNLPNEIAIQIENAQELQPIRDGIKALNYFYYILITMIFLLAMLLILLHFTLKDAMRVVGFCLLIGSILAWAGAFAINRAASSMVEQEDLGDFITKDSVVNVIKDMVGPATAYSIAFFIIALLLVIASFVVGRMYKSGSRKAAPKPAKQEA